LDIITLESVTGRRVACAGGSVDGSTVVQTGWLPKAWSCCSVTAGTVVPTNHWIFGACWTADAEILYAFPFLSCAFPNGQLWAHASDRLDFEVAFFFFSGSKQQPPFALHFKIELTFHPLSFYSVVIYYGVVPIVQRRYGFKNMLCQISHV
jgi:hypothetical protein